MVLRDGNVGGGESLCIPGEATRTGAGRCPTVRSDEDGLGTVKCGNWDVAGDLFTVSARTEIEKRFQMFHFLKKNQCNLTLAFSIQPSSKTISE